MSEASDGPSRPLKVLGSEAEAKPLTVLSSELARLLGTPYVHLCVLAIDLDRLSDCLEGVPRGFEVFLLGSALERLPDAEERAALAGAVVEDVLALAEPLEALGAALLLAIGDAAQRGLLPRKLAKRLGEAGIDVAPLSQRMQPWWERPDTLRRELAQQALACTTLSPPIAAPTRKQLEALAR